MKFLALFLSLRGRVGRLVYFLGVACNLLALPTVFFIADSIRTILRGRSLVELGEGLFLAALASSGILIVWSLLSLFVRRAADQDTSRLLGALGFFLFIGSAGAMAALSTTLASGGAAPVVSPRVAYALIIVVLVLSLLIPGLRTGTPGANRFGRDPDDETLNSPR